MEKSVSPFGLLAFLHWNHEWNDFHFNEQILPTALNQLKDLNIEMIRMDILWSDVHRGLRRYDFSKYDSLIDQVSSRGIKILAVLHYNKIYKENGIEKWCFPPDDFDEFASYVEATISRFKNRIKHWEIWNEPNLDTYWKAPMDNLKPYSKLLKKSYSAAKKADPTCVVLNGGLTSDVVKDIPHLYKEAGRESFDILNFHLFLDPLNPESPRIFRQTMLDIHKTMNSFGDLRKKVWITELGCPGIPKDKPQEKWFGGKETTEDEQADWMEKIFTLRREFPWVQKIFWAFYRDTKNSFGDATNHFGIVRHDLMPKPAFYRFKKMISEFKR